MNTKIIIALAVVALIGAFFAFDLQQYLNLQSLKDHRDDIRAFTADNLMAASLVYFVGYIMMAALALPGALIVTLAGGAIFGFWHGLLLVSFASSIGATLAFIFTRYLFRDAVERKFGDKLSAVNRGVEKEGAFYLFGMRLVPFIPFVAINSLMALTALKTTTFYWVSQLGMLAGTAVFVNAGTQLAEIESTADIFSPGLILSFVLLGVFPILAKYTLNFLRRNQGDLTPDDKSQTEQGEPHE